MQQPSLQELENALEFVNPDVPRDDWVRVLMGIKNEFGDDAFGIAKAWSEGGSSFDKDNFKPTWQSISASGGTTVATVFRLAIDNGYEPEHKELSAEEKARNQKEMQAKAKQRAEQEAKELAERQQWFGVIAGFASQLIADHTINAKSNAYLANKKVSAFGVSCFKQSLIVVMRPGFITEVVTGGGAINNFFKNLPEKRDFSFLHIKRGDLCMPLMDIEKTVWNIQIINATGGKMFLKHGRKKGLFHFIGVAAKSQYLAVVEGYATGASVHMATNWPCAVALDAGNLVKVAKSLNSILPDKKFVICADNDAKTKGNPGVEKAKEAAAAVNGLVAIPDFSSVEHQEAA